MYFITKTSYDDNFKLVFGYDFALIKKSLWQILCEGKDQRKITFIVFMDKIGKFMKGKSQHEAQLIFKLYDANNDGLLDASDIV